MAGWEMTLADFRQLIGYPAYRPTVAPLVKDWFGYEIEGSGQNTAIRSKSGELIDIDALHEIIQSTPNKQFDLYQTAMGLWR
jgi:hypothetical protein